MVPRSASPARVVRSTALLVGWLAATVLPAGALARVEGALWYDAVGGTRRG